MNLQKVVVMPIETYNSLKSFVDNDTESTKFDKDIISILRNRKLSDYEKYELYREKLIHFGSMQRKSDYFKPTSKISSGLKHLESVGSQTKFVFKKDKETSMPSQSTMDVDTQTPTIAYSKRLPPLEKVFETSNSYQSLCDDAEDQEISICNKSRNISKDNKKISPSRIVRKKLKTKHHDLDVFEMCNGDIVTRVNPEAGNISSVNESFEPNILSATAQANKLKKKKKVKKPKGTSTPNQSIIWEDWEEY